MNYRMHFECYDSNNEYIDMDYDAYTEKLINDSEEEDVNEENVDEYFLYEANSEEEAIGVFNSYMKQYIPNNTTKVILYADNEQVSLEIEIKL